MSFASHHRAATGQSACGFGVKSHAKWEKSVKLSLGRFYGALGVSPRAFHSKARSHFPITTLCSFSG